ncbi:MAG TPA: zeta toxin family protein [Puia sp.]|jgi:predicted ABC-type ATPase
MPELHFITGSNGAGKSTAGPYYLPEHIRNTCVVFNGDKIFEDKKKELYRQGIKAHKEARNIAYDYLIKIFDDLVDHHIALNKNFAYEGHFTNEATWDIPRRFKAAGFEIHLIFFGLSDSELSMLCVVDRTKEGGHYVNPMEVEANFFGNLEKMNQHLRCLTACKSLILPDQRISH